MRFVLAVLGLVLLAHPATAGDCARFGSARVVHVQQAAHYGTAVHHAAPYVPAAVFVPIYTPTYITVYDPTGGANALILQERLASIEAKLDARATSPATPSVMLPKAESPPKAAAPVDLSKEAAAARKLFAAKCATCHSGKKDGQPVLFSSAGEVIGSDRVPERIMQALRTGVMGKQKLPPLTDRERLEMTYHLFDVPVVASSP